MGRYADAVKCFKSLELTPDARFARFARKNAAFALQKRNKPGDADEARAILNNLLKENDNDEVAAKAYALLGERGKMLSLVRTLVAETPAFKVTFRTGLEFEAYRDDPEFKAIVGG